MPDGNANPERSWQETIADAARERDRQRLVELFKELECALEKRKESLSPTAKPKNQKSDSA